jgi:hypothetical protein
LTVHRSRYDWINDGTDPLSAESNFGTVKRGYENASHPRLEKPNYKAAQTLQSLLGSLQPAGAVCNTTTGEYAVRYATEGGGASSWAVWRTVADLPSNAKCDHVPNMCCRYLLRGEY